MKLKQINCDCFIVVFAHVRRSINKSFSCFGIDYNKYPLSIRLAMLIINCSHCNILLLFFLKNIWMSIEHWAYTAGSRNNILWHKQLLLNGLDNRIWARGKQIAFYTKYIVIYPSAHMPSNKNSEVMLWFDMHPAVIKLV